MEATAIPVAGGAVEADVVVPARGRGLVVFAHGSGSSRASTRNGHVAAVLGAAGIGTMLVDLLTPQEIARDLITEELRFDIPLLAMRVTDAVEWVDRHGLVDHPRGIGVFGASTGAAAALIAAARKPALVGAVVCRGGRADLADDVLGQVHAPVLFIAGSHDGPIVEIAGESLARLGGPGRMHVIPGASHLFEEPGAIDEVAGLSRDWFLQHL